MHALLPLALALSPFVSVEEGAALVERGAAVLDARPAREFDQGHLPRAQPIDWKDFRDGWGRTGTLGTPSQIAPRLAALGVDERLPVLVYGAAARGWGEEGRIDWMLEYLGHREVRILDGGFDAWRGAARPVER